MSARGPRRSGQRGLVLVTSLLLLVVVTLLAIGMFRSFGLQEKIAGNVRDKQRAVNAAEVAEQYAENFLSSGNAPGATACTTVVSYTAGQVCTTTLQGLGIDPTAIPWTYNGAFVGVNYAPPGPTPMVIQSSSTVNTYSATPRFFIGFLSSALVGGVMTNVYQIDAVAYGGNANTAAVVETTYQVKTSITPLSGP